MSPELRERIERYFLHAGMPHLQADYDPREETLTRLVPLLLLIFVLGLVTALGDETPLGRALLAAVLVALLTGAFAILNRLRGRRAFALPSRVGYVEAGVLLVAPAVASFLTDGDPRNAAYVLLVTVVLAAVLYVVVSLGIFSLIFHIGRAAIVGLWSTASVAARAMPLMLALLLFLFLSTETWQAFGQLIGWRFGGVLTLFALLVLAVLHGGLRRERAVILQPRDHSLMARQVATTPAEPLRDVVEPHVPPLKWIERLNVSVALLVSLGLRVLAVGAAVGVFFFVFGLLVMDQELTATWVAQDEDLNVLLSGSLAGRELVVSEPLIRVSALLGGFSSLYFSVSALGDPRNRQEFVEDELERASSVMAAWAYYRGALEAAPPAESA